MSKFISEEKLNSFVCRRCGSCCKQEGFVYLSSEDADNGAAFQHLSGFDFVNRYCDLQDRRRLVLKRRQDETCIFLEENGCLIYQARPTQCRDFPRQWNTKQSRKYCEGIKTCLTVDRSIQVI